MSKGLDKSHFTRLIFDLVVKRSLFSFSIKSIFLESKIKSQPALALKITGKDLLKLGIIDEVLPEPSGGNNWAPLDAGNTLKEAIEKHLNALLQMSEDKLIEERYKKFRVLGKFIEANNIEEIYSEIPQKTE